jgi:hypothetical protein
LLVAEAVALWVARLAGRLTQNLDFVLGKIELGSRQTHCIFARELSRTNEIVIHCFGG